MKRAKGEGRIARFMRGIASGTEMPLDVMMDVAKVTVIGGLQVNVANHRGVVLFSSDTIVIQTRKGPLVIEGTSLTIGSIYREQVVVKGNINAVNLHPGGMPS